MITASDKVKFIESVFGRSEVSRRGTDVAVKCPVCNSTAKDKKKLIIRLQDDACHCWVCGWASPNMLALVKRFGTREQYVQYRTQFVPHISSTKVDDEVVVEKPTLPNDFRLLVHCGKTIDPDVKSVFKYLRERAVDVDDLWKFSIGVSNGFKFKNRVIIPSLNACGELNYYVMRATNDWMKPKYLNAQTKKYEIIFNEFRLNFTNELTIVEGPFDLLKAPDNSTCLLGSNFGESSALFTKILEHDTPIVLMLDPDMKSKVQRIASLLYSYDIKVRIADVPEGYDPGKLSKKEVRDLVESAVEWQPTDGFAFKLQKITNSFSLKI